MKKVTTKLVVKKEVQKKPFDIARGKPLVVADETHRFWVNNGPALKDLKELCEALRAMNDEQFAHHVNSEKNDFAKWVAEVLEDEKCAQALLKAKTRKAAARAVKH